MAQSATPLQPFRSTWHDDPSKWDWRHQALSRLDVYRDDANHKYPVFKKTDPIPHARTEKIHIWILAHAVWPMLVQAGFKHYWGSNMPAVAVVALYSLAFQFNSVHTMTRIKKVASRTGFLDGDKHPRDRMPDAYINKGLRALPILLTSRSIMSVFLSYRSSDPIGLTWWLPLELFLYSIAVDFFFYVYHRSCHEVDALWQYHRTHHLTKHPTPLLSIYADQEQEVIEAVIVPVLSYATLKLLGLPMGFYDWWVCHQYIIFAEVLGHSGLRVHALTPGISSFVLRFIGAELVVEDHDLHHRHGWKKSCNYGKQTRLWDKLFGTLGDRIETTDANIDYENTVEWPLL